MRHSATVSKAGLCIALQCHPSVWQSATVSRAGLCIAYCKVECFQNQVSIAVQRYPKQDHLCLHCKLRRRLNRRVYYIAADCNGIQDRICIGFCNLQIAILGKMYIVAQCNGIQCRIVYCALYSVKCNGIQGRMDQTLASPSAAVEGGGPPTPGHSSRRVPR